MSCRSKPMRYLAVKILTAYGTILNNAGRLSELEVLKAIGPVDRNDVLPFLINHFEELGPHGQHLCFVVPPLSTDLASFRRSAPRKRLPLHTVKIILLCVLQALERLHGLNIIHTGLALSPLGSSATHRHSPPLSLSQTSSLKISCSTSAKILI